MERRKLPKPLLIHSLYESNDVITDERRSRKRMSATTPTDQRPHTDVTFAAEIVSPTSVSATTIEQTGQLGCTPMINLDRRRPYYY